MNLTNISPMAEKLLLPATLIQANYLTSSAWLGHIPFAFWIIQALQPKKFVELGVHTGLSYFAFLQAANYLQIPIASSAVDTWTGDAHSGKYSNEIFESVFNYSEAHYKNCSTLLRMTFDEALKQFDDGSIDLLHIDGLHTYDAVKHDFTSYISKLSKQGVVLFHDINVYRDDFGVWKLWAELKTQYPYFEFSHSAGLGVLAVGQNPTPLISWLTEQALSPENVYCIQHFFSTLAAPYFFKDEITRLKTSKSWQITAPLRSLFSLARTI